MERDPLKFRSSDYPKVHKTQITIRIDSTTVDYFKRKAFHSGIPYQMLINLYLTDCAVQQRELNLTWE